MTSDEAPVVGPWGTHEGVPIHIPSFNAGREAEAQAAYDRWPTITRDMVSRGIVRAWLQERLYKIQQERKCA